MASTTLTTMSHAPLSSSSSFPSSFPSSAAALPVVALQHACARHPAMRGERGCLTCSQALCSACVRSRAHQQCPDCRVKQGKDPHVVDVSWRVSLLVDALAQSWRAIPRRAPALLGILALSLLAPLGVALAVDTSDGWAALVLALAFGALAFALGAFLQPLLVLPQKQPTSKAKALVGALVGCCAAFVPVIAVVVGGVVVGAAFHVDDDLVGNVSGVALFVVGLVSIPIGLVWQGRAVLGLPPTLRGSVGAVVAHFCFAGAWCTVLTLLWIPLGLLGLLAGLGLVGGMDMPNVWVIAAGVLGVVTGLVVWLVQLLAMGSFAAGAARYSHDLQTLR